MKKELYKAKSENNVSIQDTNQALKDLHLAFLLTILYDDNTKRDIDIIDYNNTNKAEPHGLDDIVKNDPPPEDRFFE